jgi:hypothetical protein
MGTDMRQLFTKEVKDYDVDQLTDLIWKIGVPKDNIGYGAPPAEHKWFNSPNEGGLWQIPRQFAEFAHFIKDFPIYTFVEIGTHTGYTFSFLCNYIGLFWPVLGMTLDVDDKPSRINPNNGVFFQETSDSLKGGRADLLFIDGDHSYDWVKRDYHNVGRNSGIVVLHDIFSPAKSCKGVVKFWDELKKANEGKTIKEFDYCSGGRNLGIGVIVQDEDLKG